MANIGFIGLGNMGGPMAANLVKAGHKVTGFDVVGANVDKLVADGGAKAASLSEAASGQDAVITMLPAGRHVAQVYLDEGGIVASAQPGTLLIDCSTIDVATARAVAERAEAAGMTMLDAPVSGGVAGAAAATLTFMVGGTPRGIRARQAAA
jgi:3-hydroxyisobutyrate dehydrogenase